MIDVTQLLEAMATRIAQVEGVKKAFAVPPNTLQANHLPGVVMWLNGDSVSRIERSNTTRGSMWIASLKAQILLPRVGDTPAEFAVARELITPIVDAFSKPVREVLPSMTGHVDRVIVTGVRADVMIPFASHWHMGAEIYFEAKFHRRKPQ